MTKLFDILPGWLWAAVVAGLIASNMIAGARLSSERNAHQAFRLAHAEQVAAAEKARANEEAQRREAERELTNAIEAHRAQAQALSAEVERARAAGRVGSERVRDAARATAQLAGQACADSTSAAVRETATRAANVLADVFSLAEQRAADLAGIADERGIAGSACQRLYEETRAKLNAAP